MIKLNCPVCNHSSFFLDNRHFKICDIDLLNYIEFDILIKENRISRAKMGNLKSIDSDEWRKSMSDRKTTRNKCKWCEEICTVSTSLYCSMDCYKLYRKSKAPIKIKFIPKPKLSKKPTVRVCSKCSKLEYTKGHFQSDKCNMCADSLGYRNDCKFTFNLKDYPKEYNFLELTKLGMFHPSRNPKGMSRDHVLSIKFGKDNRVSPEIMRHPANCRLITQSENTRKHNKNIITLNELKEMIDEWELKYKK